jgi:hypothetical protein
MLRREKRAQLTKNIIAESERVIEFGAGTQCKKG